MIKDGKTKRADTMKVRYADIRLQASVNLRDPDDEEVVREGLTFWQS